MCKKSHESLSDYFLGLIESLIDESGVYPHPGTVTLLDGGFVVLSLDVDIHGWSRQFWNQIQGGQAKEVLFGLDMRAAPDQETEFGEAMVLIYWTHDSSKKLADESCFKVGVISYQYDPRIVRPIDWNNSYWTRWMMSWIQKTKPPFLVRTVNKKPV